MTCIAIVDSETGLYNSRSFGVGALMVSRYYDPSLSLWLGVDPLAYQRSWVSPYNYVQNSPINRIDPDGRLDHEWRINSETGDVEKIGEKGGDTEQYIYWINDSNHSQVISGSSYFVGPVSKNWHSSDIEYAVHKVNLWEDVPYEYQGEYTKFDLADRYNAMKKGDPYEIRDQEALGLNRKDMTWNLKDYENYLIDKYNISGSVPAMVMGYEEDMIPFDAPGGFGVFKAFRGGRAFLNGARGAKNAVKGLKSLKPKSCPGGGKSHQRRKWRRAQARAGGA